MTDGGEAPLSGEEQVVFFLPGQRFSGVDEEWLVPRLRLDPKASPFDYSPNSEGGPLGVELNGEWLDIDDFWGTLTPGNDWHRICEANDGWVIGATAEILGEWLLDSWPEVRQIATWVGAAPDLPVLALDWACGYVKEWAAMERDSTIEVTSEYLSASAPTHVSRLISAAGGSGLGPTLNGYALEDFTTTYLTGEETEVWFTSGQEFSGVSEEWLRPRLRLDPAQDALDLDSGGPHVVLDGEYIEDLDLETVLGTGPNDGALVDIEDPEGRGATAWIYGGWLENESVEMAHDIKWIGLEPDLAAIAKEWIIDWMCVWDDLTATYHRSGNPFEDESEVDPA